MFTKNVSLRNALAAGCAAGVVLICSWAFGYQTPTTIEFVVPVGTTLITGADEDKLIIVGHSDASTVMDNCIVVPGVPHSPGERPIQSAVLVHPGNGRATRLSMVILTSETAPLPNGTKLTNLVYIGSCDGGTYDKYGATVE